MPERRFPPPWTVDEYGGISYIVRAANNFPGGLRLSLVGAWKTRRGEEGKRDRGQHQSC